MNNPEFERAFAIYRASRARCEMRVKGREQFKEFFYKMDEGDRAICLEIWLGQATVRRDYGY